jgi:hypothetical protein
VFTFKDRYSSSESGVVEDGNVVFEQAVVCVADALRSPMTQAST